MDYNDPEITELRLAAIRPCWSLSEGVYACPRPMHSSVPTCPGCLKNGTRVEFGPQLVSVDIVLGDLMEIDPEIRVRLLWEEVGTYGAGNE